MKKELAKLKEQNQPTATKELVITKKEKQPLNKQQQTFNRLVKRLEKLRIELETTSTTLRAKLEFYGERIHPLEQRLVTLRSEGVKLLYGFYKDPKVLSKKDKEVLGEIISGQLSVIFQLSSEKPDEEIMAIFEAIEKISYEEAAEEDFTSMKDDMSETFKNMGFDVDLNDFHKDMNQEEMMRRMFEMFGDLQSQAEAKEAARPKRKKTKKQIEKEEREKQVEEAKSKNIAGIYKQLARVFHPDLEQDPTLKSQKEDLMKHLTTAYKKNDLHTLLRLELEWIHKEEGALGKLSDEKLSIYNQALKEQIGELQEEIFMIGQHPRYHHLQRFSLFPMGVARVDLKREKRRLETTISDLEESIAELKGKNAIKELKEIISTFKRATPEFDFFDLAELFK
jgi:hypothetical protein